MKNLLNKWFFIARFHLQDPDSEYGSGSSRRFESGSTRFPIPNTDSHPPSLRRSYWYRTNGVADPAFFWGGSGYFYLDSDRDPILFL